MTGQSQKLSAQTKLNGLTKVLAETQEDTGEKKTNPGEDAFLTRAMGIVDDWRRQVKVQRALDKKGRFQRFAQAVGKVDTGAQIRRTIKNVLRPTTARELLVFNRRLEKITDSDLLALKEDGNWLELWCYFQGDEERGTSDD